MAEVLKITQENFETEVLQSDKPVLIDFWAEWCGPCQTFIPILHSYAEKTDAVKIGKINVDENRKLAKQYRILSIPTVVLFENGEALKRHSGVLMEDELKEWIEE